MNLQNEVGRDIANAIDNVAVNVDVSGLLKDTTGQAINQSIQALATAVKPDASNIDYDNAASGLSADNVQDAIDELNIKDNNYYTHKNLPSGANIDAMRGNTTLSYNGVYWLSNSQWSGMPLGSYGYLEIQGSMQRFTPYGSSGRGDVLQRFYVNNTWTSWKRIADDLWTYDTFDMGTQTINQNARGVFTKNIVKTGYTPVGIVEIQLTNNWMYVGSFMISGNTAQVVIHNINTSDSQKVNIKVLYKIS